ncbi:MAG: hypothetical protein KH354_00575 [Clostridiales bacterium]|nr:hypothetical protein [Clostridiales bacterium]
MTGFSISAMTVPPGIAIAVCILFLLLTLSVCVMLAVTIKRARLTDADLEPAQSPKTKAAAENSSHETDVKSTLQEENRP